MKTAIARALMAFATFSLGMASAQLKAFPGAEGFGSLASGGRGGEVYIVTNRNDSGAGSFREAFNYSGTTPRTIVFETSGTITLTSRLTLNSKSNITIAGHTAPGGGILIKGDAFSLNNCSNIIVRHIRFRYNNPDADRDTISVSNGSNMIFDHVSVSWGRDECLSLTNASTNITLQNCIIAEGTRSDHQYGSLITSTGPDGRITLWRNLYINQAGRTPRAASQSGEDFLLQMVNNVVYNWGVEGDWGAESCISDNERATWNMVNNYFIAGPNTTKNFFEDLLNRYSSTILRGGSGNDQAYLGGNMIDSNRNGSLDATAAGWSNTQGGISQLNAPRAVDAWAEIGGLQTASEALNAVIADAGCTPWNRDAVDTRLINDLSSFGTLGSIRTSIPSFPTITTGAAPADTDRDGMPDEWESWYGISPTQPSNNALAPNGYTAIEQYLQWLIDPDSVSGGFTVGSVQSPQAPITNSTQQLQFTWSGFSSQAAEVTGYNVRFGVPGDPARYLNFNVNADATSVTIDAIEIPELNGAFSDGEYRCSLRAINSGGGVSNAAGLTLTVDTTPPVFSFSVDTSSPHDSPFTLTLSASEPVEGINSDLLVLENASAILQTTPIDNMEFSFLVAPVLEGPFSVTLPSGTASDRAGISNVSAATYEGVYVLTLGEGEGNLEGDPLGEGEGTLEGESPVEGEVEGDELPVEGESEGEGDVEGAVDEGQIEGPHEGELPLDGEYEGNTEGIAEGVQEGQPEGEGETEGEGAEDGEVHPEGSDETEGEGEASQEGELHSEGEGMVDGEGATEEGETSRQAHSADRNADGRIELSELLRVIQLYNAGEFFCASLEGEGSEDQYQIEPGNRDCAPHQSDYLVQNWSIDLGELLRLIQLFNLGEYIACDTSEDGACPVAAS